MNQEDQSHINYSYDQLIIILNMNLGMKLLRLSQVCELYSLSKSTIYRKRRSGEFPQPISLGGKSIAWRTIDLDRWEKSLQEVR